MSEQAEVTVKSTTKRSGVLRVSVEIIGELLRLPPTSKIKLAHVDWLDQNTVMLLIEGEDMPEHHIGEKPPNVDLICNTEKRDVSGDFRVGLRRVFGSWHHKPEKRWLMQGWQQISTETGKPLNYTEEDRHPFTDQPCGLLPDRLP